MGIHQSWTRQKAEETETNAREQCRVPPSFVDRSSVSSWRAAAACDRPRRAGLIQARWTLLLIALTTRSRLGNARSRQRHASVPSSELRVVVRVACRLRQTGGGEARRGLTVGGGANTSERRGRRGETRRPTNTKREKRGTRDARVLRVCSCLFVLFPLPLLFAADRKSRSRLRLRSPRPPRSARAAAARRGTSSDHTQHHHTHDNMSKELVSVR